MLLGAAAAVAAIAALALVVALVLRFPAVVPPLVLALAAGLAGWFRASVTGAARGGWAGPLVVSTGAGTTLAATAVALRGGPRLGAMALVAGLVAAGLLFLLATVLGSVYLPVKASELGTRWAHTARRGP